MLRRVNAHQILTCLHLCGVDGETGNPVELTYRGMRVLVPLPLAKTTLMHGTAVYA